MIKFALIGLSGFIAKKHVFCIEKLKGDLVAALDKHDNVGYIDNFYPNCNFFKNEKFFFSFIKKKKIDYLIICSPSYLHFKHIQKGLLSKTNVIVEKPPLLHSSDFKKIIQLEKKTKKNCYCIFQLREDKRLISLKNKITANTKINKVKINYYTKRGKWYEKSWKGDKKLSGGLLINIGIHFVDILLWIFGDLKKIIILKKDKSNIRGKFLMEKAIVNWHLSIQSFKKEFKNLKFKRELKVNNNFINLNKFNDLHLENYKSIIYKKKFKIKNFENLLKNIEKFKV